MDRNEMTSSDSDDSDSDEFAMVVEMEYSRKSVFIEIDMTL